MAHFISIDTETDLGHGLTGPDEGSPEFAGPFGLMNQHLNWLENDLKSAIRTIPDYPKPGILFRDITTLLGNARAFRRAVDELV